MMFKVSTSYPLLFICLMLSLVKIGNAERDCTPLPLQVLCPPTSTPTAPPTTSTEPVFPRENSVLLWVTLSLFSGMPNPSWPVYETNPKYEELIDLLQGIPPEQQWPQDAGYRGFYVENITSAGINPEWTVPAASESDLEILLLHTGLDTEDSNVNEVVQSIWCDLFPTSDSCEAPVPQPEPTPGYPTPQPEPTPPPEVVTTTTKAPCDPPTFDEKKWNDDKKKLYKNNCYNYAVNDQNDKYAQPGHKTNPALGSANDVVKAAKEDGLKGLLPDPGAGKFPDTNGDCLVALFYYKATNKAKADYHWMRQDKNGKWSHKMDGLPATNKYKGKKIDDPRTTTVDRVVPAKDSTGKLIVKVVDKYEFIGFMSYCPADIKNKITRDGNSAAREALLKKVLGH